MNDGVETLCSHCAVNKNMLICQLGEKNKQKKNVDICRLFIISYKNSSLCFLHQGQWTNR